MFMSLKIDDEELIKLLDWICEQTGETRDEALQKSLEDRARLFDGKAYEERLHDIQSFANEIAGRRIGKDKKPLTKEQVEDILGFGPNGV